MGLIHFCLKGFIENILEDNDCCMGVCFVIGVIVRVGVLEVKFVDLVNVGMLYFLVFCIVQVL